jgi:hypothetical protein
MKTLTDRKTKGIRRMFSLKFIHGERIVKAKRKEIPMQAWRAP